ncbi:hypothetical protein B0J11DRAFT_618583 [Dendryphion nanum]|uniref:Uncharacterized protein n=1 Tax=Dendryphion nanum TaxID=256645 RepID=A0A9P9DCC8_9PLEO|nr:hypothetical protein B0J11DRAFT_618583 [Dendryphion nanum]
MARTLADRRREEAALLAQAATTDIAVEDSDPVTVSELEDATMSVATGPEAGNGEPGDVWQKAEVGEVNLSPPALRRSPHQRDDVQETQAAENVPRPSISPRGAKLTLPSLALEGVRRSTRRDEMQQPEAALSIPPPLNTSPRPVLRLTSQPPPSAGHNPEPPVLLDASQGSEAAEVNLSSLAPRALGRKPRRNKSYLSQEYVLDSEETESDTNHSREPPTKKRKTTESESMDRRTPRATAKKGSVPVNDSAEGGRSVKPRVNIKKEVYDLFTNPSEEYKSLVVVLKVPKWFKTVATDAEDDNATLLPEGASSKQAITLSEIPKPPLENRGKSVAAAATDTKADDDEDIFPERRLPLPGSNLPLSRLREYSPVTLLPPLPFPPLDPSSNVQKRDFCTGVTIALENITEDRTLHRNKPLLTIISDLASNKPTFESGGGPAGVGLKLLYDERITRMYGADYVYGALRVMCELHPGLATSEACRIVSEFVGSQISVWNGGPGRRNKRVEEEIMEVLDVLVGGKGKGKGKK